MIYLNILASARYINSSPPGSLENMCPDRIQIRLNCEIKIITVPTLISISYWVIANISSLIKARMNQKTEIVFEFVL